MIKTRILKFAHGILEDHRSANDSDGVRASEDRRQAKLQRAHVRCREFRNLRYCAACHLAFDAIQSFCEKCADATEPLPSTYALEYARAEFPDLVESREDFDRIVG